MTRGGSVPYYYVTDPAHNVAGLVTISGGAVNRYRYQPFGFPEQAVEGITNNMKFAGQYHDQETGLVYMRNRYYDFRSRRFISEDPIGLAGGINTYLYSGSDPINGSDPLGLQGVPCTDTYPATISCPPREPMQDPSGGVGLPRSGWMNDRGSSSNPILTGANPAMLRANAQAARADRFAECFASLADVAIAGIEDLAFATGVGVAWHGIAKGTKAATTLRVLGNKSLWQIANLPEKWTMKSARTFFLTTAIDVYGISMEGDPSLLETLGGFIPVINTGLAVRDAVRECRG